MLMKSPNFALIKSGQSPVINKQFLDFLPEIYREMYSKFAGQKLIHHHAGEGGQAFAVPEGVHVGVGGVHNAEKHFGIIANAEIQSSKIQQAFEAGFIKAGNDVWQSLDSDCTFEQFVINGISSSKIKYEFIQELKSDKEILSIFGEFSKKGIFEIKTSKVMTFEEYIAEHPNTDYDDIDPENNITTETGTEETVSEIADSETKLFLVKILCYILNKQLDSYNNNSSDRYDIDSIITSIADRAFEGVDKNNFSNKLLEYKRLCKNIDMKFKDDNIQLSSIDMLSLSNIESAALYDTEFVDSNSSELKYTFFADTNVSIEEADVNDNNLIDKNEAVALYLAERDLDYLECYNEKEWNLFEIYYKMLEDESWKTVYGGIAFSGETITDTKYDYYPETGNLILYLDSSGRYIISKEEALELESYKTYCWDYYSSDTIGYNDNFKTHRIKEYKNKRDDEPDEIQPVEPGKVTITDIVNLIQNIIEAVELIEKAYDAYKKLEQWKLYSEFIKKQKVTIDLMIEEGAAVEEILQVDILLPEYAALYNSIGISTNIGALAASGEIIVDITAMLAFIRVMEIMTPVVANNLLVCAQMEACIEAGFLPGEYYGLNLESELQNYKTAQMTAWVQNQKALSDNGINIGESEDAGFLYVHILDFAGIFASSSIGLEAVSANFKDMSLDEGNPLFFLLSSISGGNGNSKEISKEDTKLAEAIITVKCIESIDEVIRNERTNEDKLKDISRIMGNIAENEFASYNVSEESPVRISDHVKRFIDNLDSPYKDIVDIGFEFVGMICDHYKGVYRTWNKIYDGWQDFVMPDFVKKVADTIEKTIYDFDMAIFNKIKEGLDYLDLNGIDIFNKLKETGSDIFDFIEDKTSGLYNKIKDTASRLFENATRAMPPRVFDPLVVDLGDSGIELVTKDNSEVYFDLDVNGFKEKVSWIGKNDGFLALDRNENGVIDDGTELFGDRVELSDGSVASSGFEALSDMDSNNDGVIDANDTDFSKLLIWKDENQNGISEENELTTLKENNIESISLKFKDASSAKVEGGSFITESSKVTQSNGSETEIVEYWFDTNVYDTVTGNADGSGISNAFGTMPGIKEALEKDEKGTLNKYYDDFKESNSFIEKRIIARKFLYELSGVNDEDIAVNSRGSNIDARELYIIEKCMGVGFEGVGGENPNVSAAVILKEIYHKIEMLYFNLLNDYDELYGNADLIIERTDNSNKKTLDTTLLDQIIDIRSQYGERVDDIMYDAGAYLKFYDDANNTAFYQEFRNKHLDDDNTMDAVLSAGIIIGTVETVLTISNFKWGQATYTFRFADGAEGYVDKSTWELVLTKQPDVIEEEPADETEELVQENAELLESLYTEEVSEDLAVSEISELLTSDTVTVSEENEEVFDQTDIQVMILTENMSAFGSEENVFDNTSFAENSDSSIIDQMLVNTSAQ